jgi:putative quorum-sensing-regulated virulence factor
MIVRMPFGQWKGALLSELPTDYLEWLTTITLRGPLRGAVAAEIRFRRDYTHAPSAPLHDLRLARQIVDRGYKVLARDHHPDTGGDLRTMQRLNATASWLRERLLVLA